MCPKIETGWVLQDMHTDTHTHTHTLAEVGDMEDVRGDGQGIAIGDMEEIGYVSGIMRVEGLAETTEIAMDAVESQSSTWGGFREGSQDSSGESFLGEGMLVGASGGSVGMEERLRFPVNGENDPSCKPWRCRHGWEEMGRM